jgi:hypothetical protein
MQGGPSMSAPQVLGETLGQRFVDVDRLGRIGRLALDEDRDHTVRCREVTVLGEDLGGFGRVRRRQQALNGVCKPCRGERPYDAVAVQHRRQPLGVLDAELDRVGVDRLVGVDEPQVAERSVLPQDRNAQS